MFFSLNPPITIDEEKPEKETNEEISGSLGIAKKSPEDLVVLDSDATHHTTDNGKKPSNKQFNSDLKLSSELPTLTNESHAQKKEDDHMQSILPASTSAGLSDSSGTSANKTVESYLRPTKIELLLASSSTTSKSPSTLKKAGTIVETDSTTPSKHSNFECDNNTSNQPPTSLTSAKPIASISSSLSFTTTSCTPSPPTHIVRTDPFKNIRSAGFLSKTPPTSASTFSRAKESDSGSQPTFFTR